MVLARIGTLPVVVLVCVAAGQACYQECSTIFRQKIQQLVGIQDSAVLTQRSCQATSQQLQCLEDRKATCDAASVQYVNTILNYVRADFARTCANTAQNMTSGSGQSSNLCGQRANQCYVTFNSMYSPAVHQPLKNMATICQSLNNYTACLDELRTTCGAYLGQAIQSIVLMKQQYSSICTADINSESVKECMNGTMDCYRDFNSTFLPAVTQYNMQVMCSAMDSYSQCLGVLHERQDCQLFTRPALDGIRSLTQQYSMYCGADGGQQAQQCVADFQVCYTHFNSSYFPAVHTGNMEGICRSVQQYSECTQPLFRDCGQHMAQALNSVRILKEQFSVQCDPEYQRLAACRPLVSCLTTFATAFTSGHLSAASSICTSLSSYFPCVEDSLTQCGITSDDTTVDFARLGSLSTDFCQNLMINPSLTSCSEFMTCASGIMLISTPDPTAMFDSATWCSYIEMSLNCVERAINTTSCGLANDNTILGHLTRLRSGKRNICDLTLSPTSPSPVSTTTPSPNAIPVQPSDLKTFSGKGGKEGTQAGDHTSHAAIFTIPVVFLALTILLSLAV